MTANMKFVIATVLCTLGLAHAYDFHDEAYNQLLIEQFSLSNPRARRDTTTQCIDQDSCCSENEIQNYHANDTELREQCVKETNFDGTKIRGPLTEEQKNQLKCLVECIGKEKGYLNAEGELIKKKLLADMRPKLETVTWLKPDIDTMFEKCVKDSQGTVKQEKQCNDIGMTIGHCVWKEIQLRCPIEKQKNPDKCVSLKKYLEENNRFPPPPPIRC